MTIRPFRLVRTAVFVAIVALMLPALAHAQSIAGIVRDASGAVLPGVTVEAASAALIEKTRSAVTDDRGQYQIIDLRPGSYKVTFSLAGFATVAREAIEVAGGGVTTVNADMRVGQIQETITVSGQAPVVDVQTSTSREQVLSNETVQALPASRGYGNYLAAIPGIQGSGLSSSATPANPLFASRGGRSSEGNMQIDGMNVGSSVGGGGVSGYYYDLNNAAEVQVTIAGGLAEVDRGGPAINVVPKTGGNTFSGTYFGSFAGEWAQGSNIDDELRSFGFTDPAGADQELGSELHLQRTGVPQPPLVLQQRADRRDRAGRAEPLWQPEWRQSGAVGLREGPECEGPERQFQEARGRTR